MHRSRSLIEDYSLIGDMRTAALVGRDGSVDWLCMPRFDSPALLASLLGTEDNGFWRLAPTTSTSAPASVSERRQYRGESLVMESEWSTPSGTVRVVDFMPPDAISSQLIRIVQGLTGQVAMASTLRPRFGYGRTLPWTGTEQGRTFAMAGPDAVWLDTEVETVEKDGALHSDFTVTAGESIAFTLSWAPSSSGPPEKPEPHLSLAATEEYWRHWASHCTYQGPHRAAVIRSLITLKAMTYTPTGAIVAAPTTSLPEEIGGIRNWDYRYTWLRDAATTLSAMLRTGYHEETSAWLRWLVRAVAGDPRNLQIMYTILGERELPERALAWLVGYENSTPVRVGNGAAHQLQLDVFGEVIDLLTVAHQHGVELHQSVIDFIRRLMAELTRRWREPDAGIWEIRGPLRHFTHSKIMAWLAVKGVMTLGESGAIDVDLDELANLRDAIHTEVCERGYDPVRNTFTQYYGSTELDAALLLLPRTGFLPPDDPRVIGTIAAVRHELATPQGLVHRYLTIGDQPAIDGLVGDEGHFLLTSFWLVDALALTGELDDAKMLFENLLALRNDVGLLAEEYDPRTGRQLGNFPQAFSMLGLIDSAVLLSAMERQTSLAMAA